MPTIMDYSTLLHTLHEESESVYAGFLLPLLPGLERPILGVRMPFLRTFASTIAQEDWRTLLPTLTGKSYEEQVLQGLIIGSATMSWEERLDWIRYYVKQIDNWGANDAFVSSLKCIATHKNEFYPLLQTYAQSDAPYEQRFAAVTLLWYYIAPEEVAETTRLLCRMRPVKYYAQMGVAWALTECFLVDPDRIYPLIEQEGPPQEVQRMMRRKISESLRTPLPWRNLMQQLKKKP